MLYLAVLTDAFHAMLMVGWIVGMPLLFWHRYPKASIAYCLFSLCFIAVNQISHYTLGCCVFTTIADWFYHQAGSSAPDEWFTVRASRFIFGLTPSHRGVKILTEFLVALSAVGGIYVYIRRKKHHVARKETQSRPLGIVRQARL